MRENELFHYIPENPGEDAKDIEAVVVAIRRAVNIADLKEFTDLVQMLHPQEETRNNVLL